jgi:hypothetical protein
MNAVLEKLLIADKSIVEEMLKSTSETNLEVMRAARENLGKAISQMAYAKSAFTKE